MKTLFTFIVSIIFVGVCAQTGTVENFNDNILSSSWKNSAVGVAFAESNSELNMNITTMTAYNNVSYEFPAIDISANPVVKFKMKSSKAFTLRVDLTDNNGNSTNSAVLTKAVGTSSSYSSFTFDFTGKFNQSYPSAAVVDIKKIVKVVFFFNAGSSFTGSIYMDDLTIGDAVATFSASLRKNQIGYESSATKIALIEAGANTVAYTSFTLLDAQDVLKYSGSVSAWKQVGGWNGKYFKTLDFSSFTTPGSYKLLVDNVNAGTIVIGDALLFVQTASSVVSFFNGMRSLKASDNSISFFGARNDFVDLHGGWFDATGDIGKHLSHLSYANHFNPQQIPFVAWSMMRAYEMDSLAFAGFKTATHDEIVWGADYLVRSLDDLGYFYLSVFDDWGGSSNREICEWSTDTGVRSANYQAAMREGAGISIAALAKAAHMNYKGSYTPQQYLAAAIKGYDHLKSPGNGFATKNLEYDNDHTENIIDNYCGLLAAVELYKATSIAAYLNDADTYFAALLAKQQPDGWFSSDVAGNRPFYHAADEGLPILAMVEYAKVSANVSPVKTALNKWLNWYVAITKEVENPFTYVRQYQKEYTTSLQTAKKAFFMPHKNETGYWWQGENARLASMSTAFLSASRIVNPNFNLGVDSLSKIAVSQLDWMVGKNPFGICMVTGFGDLNYPGYTGKTNIKGGIPNGISSDTLENGVCFMPYAAADWHNWRWVEQWLPHDAWYLLAITAVSDLAHHPAVLKNDCYGVLGGNAFLDSCKVCVGGTTGVAPVLNSNLCLTNVAPQPTQLSVHLYPNPATSSVKIDAVDFMSVSVFNAVGEVVGFSATSDVSLAHLSPGLYIFKVATAKGIWVEKVLKLKE